jgi:hypothetical protein
MIAGKKKAATRQGFPFGQALYNLPGEVTDSSFLELASLVLATATIRVQRRGDCTCQETARAESSQRKGTIQFPEEGKLICNLMMLTDPAGQQFQSKLAKLMQGQHQQG